MTSIRVIKIQNRNRPISILQKFYRTAIVINIEFKFHNFTFVFIIIFLYRQEFKMINHIEYY